MNKLIKSLLITGGLMSATASHSQEIVIATVSNLDMERMRQLSSHFTDRNPDVTLSWKVVDESVLRLMQSRDSKRDNPQYDVYTIGFLEGPVWAQSGRLAAVPKDLVGLDTDNSDWISQVVNGFRYQDDYYALPFYGESSITYYRKDIFRQFDIDIPRQPTWTGIEQALASLKSRSAGRHGSICLRGKPGWGENMAIFSTILNSFGGRWFDMEWSPQLESDSWRNAVDFYLTLQASYGIPLAWQNGYSESLAAFTSGGCDIWVDSTAAGTAIAGSDIYESVGYSYAPMELTDRGSNWLWSWGFAVPDRSEAKSSAWRFIKWATSNDYHRLVESQFGIQYVPPGTRKSLYENSSYQQFAHFSEITMAAIEATDFDNPSMLPVPYKGVQFVQTAEFQQIGDYFGGKLSELLHAKMTGAEPDQAKMLKQANAFTQSAYNVAEYLRKKGIDAF